MLLPKKVWVLEDMEDLWPIYGHALDEQHFQLKFFPNFDNFARIYSQQEEKDQPDLILADITLEGCKWINPHVARQYHADIHRHEVVAPARAYKKPLQWDSR